MAVIVAEVVRAGRFVSGAIRALRLRVTPNPYSTAEDSWHKKHNDDGVNGAGNDEDRDYFALLKRSFLLTVLTSGEGNCQNPLTCLRMTTVDY